VEIEVLERQRQDQKRPWQRKAEHANSRGKEKTYWTHLGFGTECRKKNSKGGRKKGRGGAELTSLGLGELAD